MRSMQRHTLIIPRRTLAEPKTALAGVMDEISFARFIASMATSNAGRAPSRSFNFKDSVAIVGTRRWWEKIGRRTGCVGKSKPHIDERGFRHDTPRVPLLVVASGH